MADITWADVIEIATELADPAITSGGQTTILTYVNSTLDVNKFSPAALRLARINLAAHIATMTAISTADATFGPVIQEQVGGITRMYAAISAAGSGDNLDESVYGTTFKFLVRSCRARLPFVAGT